MPFRWLYVGLKNPLEYIDKWGHLGRYALLAPEDSSPAEKDERCFMFYLIGNGLKWEGWENDAELAKQIIGSKGNIEANQGSIYKDQTKFTFSFGELFEKDGLIGLINEKNKSCVEIKGKPLGRGFMVEIWNNHHPEITEKDLIKYMRPMIKFVMEHPKSAKVIGIQYGSVTKPHRQS